jgi:hypothetical protein
MEQQNLPDHAGLDPAFSAFLDNAKASLLVPPTRE